MVTYMGLWWPNYFFYVVMLLFSFSSFTDCRSLNIEKKINNTTTLTAKVTYMGQESLELGFIQILILDGWNYL